MGDDSPTSPGHVPGGDDPRVRHAVALELLIRQQQEVERDVDALAAVVRPFARMAEAGALVVERGADCLSAASGPLRGVWGGPILVLVVALVAGLALSCAGWGPGEVAVWTGDTIRAVRCDAGPLTQAHTDPRGAVEAPTDAPH